MSALRDRLTLGDFSAGMWRDRSSNMIPQNACWDLRNRFIAEDGSVPKRGGTRYLSRSSFGSLRAIWDILMEPGQRTIFASRHEFGTFSIDGATPISIGGSGASAPVSAAYLNGMLFIAGGWIYGGARKPTFHTHDPSEPMPPPGQPDLGLMAVKKGSRVVEGARQLMSNVDAGALFRAGPGERCYVVKSVDSNTQVTLTEPYEGVSRSTHCVFYRLFRAIDEPYISAEIYCVHANRLLVAEGNRLRFSDIGKPHSFPDFNYHRLPDGVEIIGLSSVGNIVVVFTNAGIWTLRGMALDIVDPEGNPNHQLSVFSRELVLWSESGIANWHGALVVPCTDGVFLIDGVSAPVRMSRPIQSMYRAHVMFGYRAGQAVVHEGCYLLPICDDDGGMQELFVAYLERAFTHGSQRIYPWSRIDGYPATMPAFAIRTGTAIREPKLLGASAKDGQVVECQTMFEPDYGNEYDADGSVPVADVVTNELGSGAGTKNVVRELRTRYELVGDTDPVLRVAWSRGETRADTPRWDEVNWDEFSWAGDELETLFTGLARHLPATDGIDPAKCRVGKRLRNLRLRFRGADPTAADVVRQVEMFIRPSGSVRQ